MESVACDLCGANDASEIAVVPDLLLNRPKVRARLVRCNSCGLVYQNPRPTANEIGAHYPPSYELYDDARALVRNGPLRWAYEYGMRKRSRYVTRAISNGRLLDVGCAVGTFLISMKSLPGWQVQGVELDAHSASIARDRYRLNVFTGTVEDAAFTDASFDVVTLWDVLEHVHDPVATLRELNRILRPGGAIVLRVPNLASWDAALFGRNWSGFESPRHLYVYTPETLARSLKVAGFEQQTRSTDIGSFVIFAQNIRFWMTANCVNLRTQKVVKRLLYSPISRLLSAPFFFVPSRVGAGPLLVVVARKPHSS